MRFLCQDCKGDRRHGAHRRPWHAGHSRRPVVGARRHTSAEVRIQPCSRTQQGSAGCVLNPAWRCRPSVAHQGRPFREGVSSSGIRRGGRRTGQTQQEPQAPSRRVWAAASAGPKGDQRVFPKTEARISIDGLVKSPIRPRRINIGVTLHPSSLRRTLSTPHSSGFASLDLELFPKPSAT